METIAYVFGWPPSVMDEMSIGELLGWSDRAARIHNRVNGGKD